MYRRKGPGAKEAKSGSSILLHVVPKFQFPKVQTVAELIGYVHCTLINAASPGKPWRACVGCVVPASPSFGSRLHSLAHLSPTFSNTIVASSLSQSHNCSSLLMIKRIAFHSRGHM